MRLYFKFEAQYGKTWLLPPEVWFHRGGFKDGERISFTDEHGVPHYIEVISTRREGGNVLTTLVVDHSFQTLSVQVEGGDKARAASGSGRQSCPGPLPGLAPPRS